MNHSIKKTYLVFTMLLGFILLAGCNGDNNNDNSNNDNNGVLLTSIAVTPATPSMPLGLKQQFTAMGTYSDGTSSDITNSATWSSDDSTVATINGSGLAMGVIPGSVAITASLIDSSSNEQSATTTLTITDATLTALAITPVNPSLAKGLTKQFMATGTYSDGTSPDVTTSVTWSSANTLVATVNASGLASGVAIGSSIITASLGSDETTTELNITDAILSSIALTPVEPSIAKGITQQFTAIGTYSDGISVDITASSNWSSADTLVATMNTSGAAKGVSIGSSIITADFQAQSATSLLTVTDASLTSIMLTPANPHIPKGNTLQLTATGIYSDGISVDITSSAIWSSADTLIATVNADGVVSGITSGSAIITATSAALSATTTVTVTDTTLTSIAVTPGNQTIVKGSNKQLTATGTYSDGSLANITASVTWSSADTLVATVNNSGLASGIETGSSLISASSGALSGSTNLTITGAALNSIVVSPTNLSLVKGMNKQFAATATYSDGSVADISTSVTWSSADTLVATIDVNGLANGKAAGSSLITATSGAQSNSTNLTVTDATLNSIDVTPINPSIIKNSSQNFVATGHYSDGSTTNITSTVMWSSADTLVATLNPNEQLNSGRATAIEVGSSVIQASLSGVFADTTLNVTAALPNNPLAPELGEVARFAMLASQAITTTSGSAIVDGDLGILDQARSYYAGFTPGVNAGEFDELTNGLSYAGDDSTPPYVVPVPYASMVAFINQSRTDLGIAYNFLAADPNPNAATQVCPIELGNLTLTRGVYKTAADVTLQTGTLTLDGEGDPDSVFIFTIGGNLTSGAPGGDIVLINGAQAKNIYWRTAGKTVIGTNTNFSGNVFAWSEVNVRTGANVTGRLFAVTDQVTLDANAVTKAN
ncbi:Ig-like domain-containing protein [Shewanella frigidimarina]|uniref:Ice-binding protein 1 n=1 Tax=Shewanella frigidimarina (strain NCIMB 400) TaxID=318167 RepID=IBP1_SHEFN|nr:Ig-like domain-containing protein [Shewanella frigidimarina]Q086E4.1 RecName: Full=Ice-binding protein 1; AltName: Full=Antifreeze protein 1; Short=AFP 1; AltName: Full=Ice adhesin 1; Flags: Precursor [Shewanella frigidimarina NCIMB 400]ABI70871.1 Ig domain protein, group 2 domain protein [Shewanella frigidimarina NCIMB 400]